MRCAINFILVTIFLSMLSWTDVLASEESNDKTLEQIKKELAELRQQNQDLQSRLNALEGGKSNAQLEKEIQQLNERFMQDTNSPSSWLNFLEEGHHGLNLKMSGQLRERAEYFDHTDGSADLRILQRFRLNMDIGVNDYVNVFAQLQDSRAYGDDPLTTGQTTNHPALEEGLGNGVSTTADTSPNFHQLYLNMRDFFGTAVDVRLGRQEISLGSERMVGAFDWNNVGRSFEGIRGDTLIYDGKLTAFAAVVRNNFADSIANEDRLYGLYYVWPLEEIFSLDLQSYFREDAASDVNLWYVGARAYGNMDVLDYEFEYNAGQSEPDSFGITAASDGEVEFSSSYYIHGSAGLTIEDIEGAPRLGFAYDHGSLEYVNLFPTNHGRFGLSDIFVSPSNLVHTEVNFDIGVAEDWTLGARYHWNRAFQQAGSDELGTEADIYLKGTCADLFKTLIAFGKQFGGDGLATFGAAAPWVGLTAATQNQESTFGYLQLTLDF